MYDKIKVDVTSHSDSRRLTFGLLIGIRKYSSKIFQVNATKFVCFLIMSDTAGLEIASARWPKRRASAAPLLRDILFCPPKTTFADAVTRVGAVTSIEIKKPLFLPISESSSV